MERSTRQRSSIWQLAHEPKNIYSLFDLFYHVPKTSLGYLDNLVHQHNALGWVSHHRNYHQQTKLAGSAAMPLLLVSQRQPIHQRVTLTDGCFTLLIARTRWLSHPSSLSSPFYLERPEKLSKQTPHFQDERCIKLSNMGYCPRAKAKETQRTSCLFFCRFPAMPIASGCTISITLMETMVSAISWSTNHSGPAVPLFSL